MPNKIGVISIALIGIIVIAFSITAFFLLDIERIAVNVWALAFLLLAELALFGGLIGLRFIGANHGKVFLRTGIATVLWFYFIATFVSVLFARAFRENLKIFILIELTIIVLFAIVAISIFAVSRSIAARDEVDITKVGTNEPKRGGF
ncbi:MAG: hypothetical protein FWD70_02820 [Desulfuromonadales bacterium]|nr:hypothetical protein [Desulfuromonadales bacterium]